MTPEEVRELYSRINVRIDSDWWEYPPLPMDDKLDTFEKEFGITLPAGYRHFINTFGPGRLVTLGPNELVMEFSIFSPVKLSQHTNRSLSETRMMDYILSEYFEDPKQMFHFAGSIFADFYLFHTGEISTSDPLEYNIYIHKRFPTAPVKIASSFSEFISDYCVGQGAFDLYHLEEYPDKDELTTHYDRTPQRRNKPQKKKKKTSFDKEEA